MLSLSSQVPLGPREARWAQGAGGTEAFHMGESSECAVPCSGIPKPLHGDCHLLAGVTHGGKEAFKLLPTVGAAFWTSNNTDDGLPAAHEGRLEFDGNFARVFQKGCVCC